MPEIVNFPNDTPWPPGQCTQVVAKPPPRKKVKHSGSGKKKDVKNIKENKPYDHYEPKPLIRLGHLFENRNDIEEGYTRIINDTGLEIPKLIVPLHSREFKRQ